MTQSHRSNDLNIRIGVWSSTEETELSSNWKEFGNVVGAIENEGKEGRLKNAMTLFTTDNTTVEGAIDKGNTPSRNFLSMYLKLNNSK